MYERFSYVIALVHAVILLLLTLNFVFQYNFVGRLLGPRGNSLKRVEASTECRVLIRGRGSIKDPAKVMIIFLAFPVCVMDVF